MGITAPPVIRATGTIAVRVWASVYRVVSALPDQRIWEAGTNAFPFTVRVKLGWPAEMLVGDRPVMVGDG
jgi:hypothetical protein